MAAYVIFPLIIAVIAAVVTASADLSSIASLDVSRVLGGEVWRLVTGHLTHLTWRQYAVDTAAFVLLYATYGRKAGSVAAVCLFLFAALCVSASVVLMGTHQVYGGLSGLSCAALFALLFAAIMEQPRRVTAYLVGFVCCAYLYFMGGSGSGVNVAGEAHVAGSLAGMVFALLRCRLFKSLSLTLVHRVDQPSD